MKLTWMLRSLGLGATLSLAATTVGCPEGGPMEEAGENLDEAGDEIEETVDEVTE